MSENASKAKRGVGRPSKLTAKVMKKFLDALRAGSYLQDAADYAGIGRSTSQLWMAKGRAGEAPEYVGFLEAVELALAESVSMDLETIGRAAKGGDWRAAAWRLEHRHPAKFGPQVRVVEQEVKDFLDRVKGRVPLEVYEQILAAALADAG